MRQVPSTSCIAAHAARSQKLIPRSADLDAHAVRLVARSVCADVCDAEPQPRHVGPQSPMPCPSIGLAEVDMRRVRRDDTHCSANAPDTVAHLPRVGSREREAESRPPHVCADSQHVSAGCGHSDSAKPRDGFPVGRIIQSGRRVGSHARHALALGAPARPTRTTAAPAPHPRATRRRARGASGGSPAGLSASSAVP